MHIDLQECCEGVGDVTGATVHQNGIYLRPPYESHILPSSGLDLNVAGKCRSRRPMHAGNVRCAAYCTYDYVTDC